MVKGTNARCVKFFVVMFNFLLLIAGLGAVALGLYSLLDKGQVNFLGQTNKTTGAIFHLVSSGATVIAVAGGVLTVIALLGCCGAARESKCLLSLYIGHIILALVIEAIGGGVAAYFMTTGTDDARALFVDQVKVNYDGRGDTNRTFGKALDFAQVEFDCCGVNNYTEFKELAVLWTERQSRMVPLACCKLNKTEFYRARIFTVEDPTCAINPTPDNSNINNACFDEIRSYLMSKTLYLVLLAFVSVLVQIIGLVFACCLLRCVKR